MILYVLRHGIAVKAGSSGRVGDAERGLTREGYRKVRGIAEVMRKGMGLDIEAVMSSPYLRARQTAEVVVEAFGGRPRWCEVESLKPGGTPEGVVGEVRRLKGAAQGVVLVGHEPSLSELVGWLLTGGTEVGMELKKGGLCKVRCEGLGGGGCGTLEWLLTPKQMLGML